MLKEKIMVHKSSIFCHKAKTRFLFLDRLPSIQNTYKNLAVKKFRKNKSLMVHCFHQTVEVSLVDLEVLKLLSGMQKLNKFYQVTRWRWVLTKKIIPLNHFQDLAFLRIKGSNNNKFLRWQTKRIMPSHWDN